MLIGTMNHPGADLISEIQWIAALGFEFIDLTLEPPRAIARSINVQSVASALKDSGLNVVGHTAFYLPLCSPFESIRQAAVDELKACLDVFAQLGVKWMNLHPDRQAPFYDRRSIIDRNVS